MKCLTGETLVANAEGLSPIREIKVGDRIVTTEESYLGETAVDEATWKVVRVRIPEDANWAELKLELLRSPEWIAAMGAKLLRTCAFGTHLDEFCSFLVDGGYAVATIRHRS